MIITEDAKKIPNTENISKQIATNQFINKYGDKYKDTKAWRTFKEKYIKKYTKLNLKIEYFYDEQLKSQNIKF